MEQSELLRHLVSVLERLNVRYFITGSVASTAYGESRFTNDIDVVADLSAASVPGLIKGFPPPFNVSHEAALQAVHTCGQINILDPESGLKIDLIIPQRTELDRLRLDRVRRLAISAGVEANFASPEDLILKKMDF